ncbi:UNVERIFIED_CONTAM: hypothetical protein GTU68_006917 [Idotea baltica]|nr:hypothetical protein [Idotea baltica]
MRAIVIHKAKDLHVEQSQAGEPGEGEVRVKIARGGICGSDLHYYNDGGFGPIHLKEPMILGHEVAEEFSGQLPVGRKRSLEGVEAFVQRLLV